MGLPDHARCYECTGGSMASDVYTAILAIDVQCERATFTRTVNMSPATAARCLTDTTRTELCREAIAHEPGRYVD